MIADKHDLYGMVADMNVEEILSHEDMGEYLARWRAEMIKRLDKVFEEVEQGTAHTNLYVRDRYHNTVHRIGDDVHDHLYVDDDGTVHFENMQNGDGCIGYNSLERTTIGEKYPNVEWENGRDKELCYGYEFVPCNLDCQYCKKKCPWDIIAEQSTKKE